MAGHCGWAAAQAQSGPTVGDHAVRLCGNTTADEAGPPGDPAVEAQPQRAAQRYLCGLTGRGALLLLPLLLLLLQLLNALLQHVRPEVPLKVGQLLGAGKPVFSCLFQNVLENDRVQR